MAITFRHAVSPMVIRLEQLRHGYGMTHARKCYYSPKELSPRTRALLIEMGYDLDPRKKTTKVWLLDYAVKTDGLGSQVKPRMMCLDTADPSPQDIERAVCKMANERRRVRHIVAYHTLTVVARARQIEQQAYARLKIAIPNFLC